MTTTIEHPTLPGPELFIEEALDRILHGKDPTAALRMALTPRNFRPTWAGNIIEKGASDGEVTGMG